MLPTKKKVLQRILHEDNWRTKQAADLVAKKLKEHWLWCNVYTVSVTIVSKKLLNYITKKFKFVNSYLTKKREKIFETHLDDFLSDIDTLFNIFCHDREQRWIQEEHKLRMNDSDLAFYYD